MGLSAIWCRASLWTSRDNDQLIWLTRLINCGVVEETVLRNHHLYQPWVNINSHHRHSDRRGRKRQRTNMNNKHHIMMWPWKRTWCNLWRLELIHLCQYTLSSSLFRQPSCLITPAHQTLAQVHWPMCHTTLQWLQFGQCIERLVRGSMIFGGRRTQTHRYHCGQHLHRLSVIPGRINVPSEKDEKKKSLTNLDRRNLPQLNYQQQMMKMIHHSTKRASTSTSSSSSSSSPAPSSAESSVPQMLDLNQIIMIHDYIFTPCACYHHKYDTIGRGWKEPPCAPIVEDIARTIFGHNAIVVNRTYQSVYDRLNRLPYWRDELARYPLQTETSWASKHWG
jgi:hypothetical protein